MVEQLGKYQLQELVAVGGMAEIYRATTTGLSGLEKVLAIKRLHEQYTNDRDFIDMLVDEARIAIQLSHKNICQVFDLEQVGEQYFLSMEYIDGRDLSRVIRRFLERDELMPLDMAVFIAQEICAGISYAHRRADSNGEPLGIIHRDMSPQNVLLSFEGEVKVVDFGIAKATTSASLTQSGVIKGKFHYMSPEQARGDRIDQRVDLWAIGAILYEMVSGQMLYQGEEDADLIGRVRRAEFIPIRHLAPDIPDMLEAIINKALARDIRMRFETALDMHMALASALHSLAGGSPYNNMLLSQQMHDIFETGETVSSGVVDVIADPMSRVDYRPDDASSVIYRLNTEELEYFQSGDHPALLGSPATSPGRPGGAYAPGGPYAPAGTDPGWRPEEHEEATTLLYSKDKMQDFIREAADLAPALSPELTGQPLPARKRAARPRMPIDRESIEQELIANDPKRQESTALTAMPNPWNDGWAIELIQDPGRGKPMTGLFLLALMGLLLFAWAFLVGTERWLLSGEGEASAAAATPASGFQLHSDPPGALLFIDGDNQGRRTPAIITDLEGQHDVRLELAHHERLEQRVEFVPGEKVVLEMTPRDGKLVVVTRPARSKVHINGEEQGRAPVTLDAVPMSDTFTIAVSHDGYQSALKTVTWELTDGDTKTVEFLLEPTFEIITEGLAAAASQSLVGTYSREELEAQGLLPSSRPVRRKLDSKSRKPSGSVSIMSKPPGKIFVDGKDIGRSTPARRVSIPAGNHRVKIYFPSTQTYSGEKTIQVRPGKTMRLLIEQ